jgi:hypothetical protein
VLTAPLIRKCRGVGLFVTLLVTGCDQWLIAEGRVVDRQERTPIRAAVITFYGSHLPDAGIRVITDSLGQFRVFDNVAPGAQLHRLTVEASKYPQVTFQPKVKGTALPELEIELAGPLTSAPSRIMGKMEEEPAQ